MLINESFIFINRLIINWNWKYKILLEIATNIILLNGLIQQKYLMNCQLTKSKNIILRYEIIMNFKNNSIK